MADMNIVVEGGRDLRHQLERMSDGVRFDTLRDAVKAGLKPIEKATKARINDRTGNLKRSIKSEITDSERFSVEGMVLNDARIGPHAHLVEFGHALVKGGTLDGGGRIIGQVPPHPFMRPAFEAEKKNAERKVAQELERAIERAAR